MKLKQIKIRDIIVPIPLVETLEIKESIERMIISGKLFVNDIGLFRKYKFDVGDDIQIDILLSPVEKPDAVPRVKTLTFVIHKIDGNNIIPDKKVQPITVSFSSWWSIWALTRSVSRTFKDLPMNMLVGKLMDNACIPKGYIDEPCELTDNNDEKYFTNMTYTSPLWTVPHSLRWLSKFALNKENKAGFVVFPNLDDNSLNFFSMEKLLDGSFAEIMKDKWFQDFDDSVFIGGSEERQANKDAGRDIFTLVQNTENQKYLGNVESLTMAGNTDIIKFINQGYNKSNIIAYNRDNGKLFNSYYGIDGADITHLANTFPIQKKYIADIFASNIYVNYQNTLQVLGFSQSQYISKIFNAFNINIIVTGFYFRRLGMKTRLDIVDDEGNRNEKYSGDYIIKSIKHVMDGSIYAQYCGLCLDGNYEKNDKMIQWQKEI